MKKENYILYISIENAMQRRLLNSMKFVNNNEEKKKLTGSSYTQNVLKCLPLFNFIWLVRYHKSSSFSITCFTYYGIVRMGAVDMEYLFYFFLFIRSVNFGDKREIEELWRLSYFRWRSWRIMAPG